MLYVDIKKRLASFELRIQFETDKTPLGLLGASGAGKSYTLKAIAGIERPDSGRIILNGKTLFDSEKKINLPPQKRKVGYLFQDFALFPNMTVLQNIKTGLHREERKEREKLAMELIEKFRLEGLENVRPQTLSGGEKQRAALARIFASKPDVLLLDEPFSSLDTFLKWELEEEMKQIFASFSGDVIIVSHEIDEVFELCEEVVRIRDGAAQKKISVKDFYNIILQENKSARISLSKEKEALFQSSKSTNH